MSVFEDVPQIKSLVVGDTDGSFTRAESEPDGESTAAVMGFMWNTITEPGEVLGLGTPKYITFQSSSKAFMVVNTEGKTLKTVEVDPEALSSFYQTQIIELLENEE